MQSESDADRYPQGAASYETIMSPTGKLTHGQTRSVWSVHKIQKQITMVHLACGAHVTSSYASIAAFGSGIWFGDILRRHNDDSDPFHFSDPHKVLCIGNVAPDAEGEEIFLNLATMWGILNLACTAKYVLSSLISSPSRQWTRL